MELRFAPRSVSPKLISSISSSHDGDSWTFREQFRVSRVQGEEGKSLEFHLGARFHFPTSFPERRRCPLAPGSSRVGWGERRRCHSHPLLFPWSRKVGSQYRLEDRVTYYCNRGLTLRGSEQRTCLEGGSWSGTEPSCQGDPYLYPQVRPCSPICTSPQERTAFSHCHHPAPSSLL